MVSGVFLGLQSAYGPDTAGAQAVLAAANARLDAAGLPALPESAPVPAAAIVDQGDLRELGEVAREFREHLFLVAINPCRVLYAPHAFRSPFVLPIRETCCGRETPLMLGSVAGLARDLADIASGLGIPMSEATVAEAVATGIRSGTLDIVAPTRDPEGLVRRRKTWLELHTAVLAAVTASAALCVAPHADG